MDRIASHWKSYFLLAIVSGFLTAIGGLISSIWFLVWIGPAAFFYTLLSLHTQSRARACILGALFGFSLNFTVSATAWSAYPLDWIGISNPLLSVAIIGILSVGVSLMMGLGHTLLALTVYEMRSREWGLVLITLSMPLLWIMAELLQAFFYSLYMLGPTSTINAFFIDASIGYTLGNAHEFWFSLARWGGLPTLVVFPVLVNVFLAHAALAFPSSRKMQVRLIAAAGVFCTFLILSAAAGYAAERSRGITSAWENTEQLTVVAGMTDFPAKLEPDQEVLAARTDIVFDIARELAAQHINPDVLILPETIGSRIDRDGYARITELLPNDSLVVYSKYTPDGDRTIAQLLAHTIGGTTAVTDKQLIMPYGEYPPYHFLAPLWLMNRDLYHAVRRYREYEGGTTTVLGEARGVPIGVRACSEIFSPQLYRTLARSGAGLLAQSSSIKIFEGAPLLESTMRSAARIRAVENGLPLVQAFNGGESRAYDCRGKELVPTLVAETFKVYSIPRSAACAGY